MHAHNNISKWLNQNHDKCLSTYTIWCLNHLPTSFLLLECWPGTLHSNQERLMREVLWTWQSLATMASTKSSSVRIFLAVSLQNPLLDVSAASSKRFDRKTPPTVRTQFLSQPERDVKILISTSAVCLTIWYGLSWFTLVYSLSIMQVQTFLNIYIYNHSIDVVESFSIDACCSHWTRFSWKASSVLGVLGSSWLILSCPGHPNAPNEHLAHWHPLGIPVGRIGRGRNGSNNLLQQSVAKVCDPEVNPAQSVN